MCIPNIDNFLFFISDKKWSNFFHWKNKKVANIKPVSSATAVVIIFVEMHRTKDVKSAIIYVFTKANLYLRLDNDDMMYEHAFVSVRKPVRLMVASFAEQNVLRYMPECN